VINSTSADSTQFGTELRQIFRRFRRQAYLVRDVLKDMPDQETATFSLETSKNSGTRTLFEEPATFARLAAVLRPFMSRRSEIEISRVRSLVEEAGLLTDTQRQTLDGAIKLADNLGMLIKVNDRVITGSDVAFAYGDGAMFDEDPEARALLEELSFGPMRDLIPFLFHTACANYVDLLQVFQATLAEVTAAHPDILPVSKPVNPSCIYCLSSEGSFTSEEHVIPEAFGQDEMVLTGCVCDQCNNRLSTLDQFLSSDFDPLALLRVLYVPLTKKGEFPKSRWREAEIAKTRPRNIVINSKGGQGSPMTVEELPGGMVKASLKLTSRKKVDEITLARALFKIGLGLVAFHMGPAAARDPRYNPARDFLNGKRSTMPGTLWMGSDPAPNPSMQTYLQHLSDHQTAVAISFFGLWMVLDLDDSGEPLLPDGLPGLTAFPLHGKGDEPTETSDTRAEEPEERRD
jgi:hypothetical protein